jgi:hypothetical protein
MQKHDATLIAQMLLDIKLCWVTKVTFPKTGNLNILIVKKLGL